MSSEIFSSREQVFDFLDNYAVHRRDEIDREGIKKDRGLIKSYWMEVQAKSVNGFVDVLPALKGTNWEIIPIGDEGFFKIISDKISGDFGFVEPLSERHMVIHTTRTIPQNIDNEITRTVKSSSILDHSWLSGFYFQSIWQQIIYPQMPERLVKFKFESRNHFDDGSWEDIPDDEYDNDDLFDTVSQERFVEQPTSVIEITERSSQIAKFLPLFQRAYHPFNAIKMLRIPAATSHGGFEFWSWGKVTYRAQSFREGRAQLLSIVKIYEQITKRIEELIWLQAEKTNIKNDIEAITLHGAPVTITFDPPLSESTFRNLVTTTFEKGQGPLRLRGNPIWVGPNKAHIYGIDLHLWQRIYMEITPKQIVVVLPQGTCGNTIHRLITNVERYVSPGISAYIGDIDYKNLITDAFLGRFIV